jgi:cysteine desulfurase
MAAVAGFAKALQAAQQIRQEESSRLACLRQEFEDGLKDLGPKVAINGSKHRAPHLVNVTFPGFDNERLMMELDEAGIMCAVGSACSASRGEASHVLSAIGLSEADARATLRFSLGRHTTKAGLQKTLKELARLTA